MEGLQKEGYVQEICRVSKQQEYYITKILSEPISLVVYQINIFSIKILSDFISSAIFKNKLQCFRGYDGNNFLLGPAQSISLLCQSFALGVVSETLYYYYRSIVNKIPNIYPLLSLICTIVGVPINLFPLEVAYLLSIMNRF